MSHWFPRFLLVVALVFSQALYAGHGVVHAYGDQVDCHICLQASSGGAALVGAVIGPPDLVCNETIFSNDIQPANTANSALTPPARAPPFSPV